MAATSFTVVTSIYANDIATDLKTNSATPVASSLSTLPWPKMLTPLTICGYSLGGAFATLLALDVAARSTIPALKSPTAYTYGSQRVIYISVYCNSLSESGALPFRWTRPVYLVRSN
jgi:hypothetical protein